MKLNKLTAVGATLAIAVGSVIGISAAASAVEVPIDEIGQEVAGGGYLADQWFVGDPAGPALTQTEDGLTIPGRNQFLYGLLETGVTGAEFEALIEDAAFDGTGPLTFQVPVYMSGTTGFTTLQPTTTGTPVKTTTWMSSQKVAGLEKFTPYTFDQIVAAIEGAGDNATVLAFGVFVGPGATAELQSVTWGEDFWTFATPTEAVAPTPIEDSATFTG
jgi:hypothetical protein